MKEFIHKYRFFLIMLMIDLILLTFEPNLGKRSLSLTWDYILEMLSIVPPIFILMGLMDVWIPKETMIKFLGKKAGVKGTLFSFLLGSFSSGPLYAAFPIACMFIKKGASLFNIFIFLGAWSTTKIPMMLFEATQLGSTFTILRFSLNAIGIILTAWIIEKTTPKKEYDELSQTIS